MDHRNPIYLWVSMRELGYPAHIINLLTKLYGKQQAKVRL